MGANLKGYLRDLLTDTFIWDLRERSRDNHEVETWENAGRPVPPPAWVKRHVLAAYGVAFGTGTLVETGTFMGGTVYALKDRFKTIYSIELSDSLMKRAKNRFHAYSHIHILHGDSGELLPELLSGISEPCLFWLDGHYSGGITAQAGLDTPIVNELMTIFDHEVKDHIVLIDDARLFNGTQDYPTIEELREIFARKRPNYQFSVVNDVIRAHPPKTITLEY
jgi:hypothetical protein